jgi:hypothetical protein
MQAYQDCGIRIISCTNSYVAKYKLASFQQYRVRAHGVNTPNGVGARYKGKGELIGRSSMEHGAKI